MKSILLKYVLFLNVLLVPASDDDSIQRPFYIIGHMANSVSTMDTFLREGSNGVEIDVSFEPNGAAWWVHHGVPCDYFRICHESTQVVDYLRAAASRNMTLIFLDLKCSKLNEAAKKFGGIDLARKLYGHFWQKGGTQTNVVLSIPFVSDKTILASFIDEMRQLNPAQLERVSFDVSENPYFHDVAKMYRELNVTSAWQGDGVTNWFEPFRGYGRVKSAVKMRDSNDSYIKKIYRWTVDYKVHIRQLIEMGVDGVITNNPVSCVTGCQGNQRNSIGEKQGQNKRSFYTLVESRSFSAATLTESSANNFN